MPTASLQLPDGTTMPLKGTVILGRADLAKFASQAEAGWISRQHLTLLQNTDGKFFIEDSGSANGTKLNNVDIKQKGRQELKDGDTINVADAVKLQFRSSAPVLAAT
jgi:pSer/pThr/pTyr-binding forkhead associated (FHA) protein